MNKITDAILKAQFLLKDNSNLSEILAVLAKASELAPSDIEANITPEVQGALDTIDAAFKQKVS